MAEKIRSNTQTAIARGIAAQEAAPPLLAQPPGPGVQTDQQRVEGKGTPAAAEDTKSLLHSEGSHPELASKMQEMMPNLSSGTAGPGGGVERRPGAGVLGGGGAGYQYGYYHHQYPGYQGSSGVPPAPGQQHSHLLHSSQPWHSLVTTQPNI